MEAILLALKPFILPLVTGVIGWLTPRRNPVTDWFLFGAGVSVGILIMLLVRAIA